jgi:hypothetical protein
MGHSVTHDPDISKWLQQVVFVQLICPVHDEGQAAGVKKEQEE